MNLRSIDPNVLILLYQESFTERGEEPGAVDAPRLDAALAYPLGRAASGSADVATIAAAYAAGMLEYRPFATGNVRAALLALELFLTENGWELDVPLDEVLMVIQRLDTVAADEAILAHWIRQHL